MVLAELARDHRRPGHPARGARRPAAGAAAGRPALLRARASRCWSSRPGTACPTTGCRPIPTSWPSGCETLVRLATPKKPGRAGAHHPRLGRRGAAEGAAARALRRGGRRCCARADASMSPALTRLPRRERLWPRRHGDGAGRVRRARRLDRRLSRPASKEPVRIDLFGDEIEAAAYVRCRSASAPPARAVQAILQPMSEVVLTPDSVAQFRAKYREMFGTAGSNDVLYKDSISQGRRFLEARSTGCRCSMTGWRR